MLYIRSVERFFLVFILMSMPFLYSFGVLAQLFGSDLSRELFWVDELVRFELVLMVFLGIGYVHDRGAHISMDILQGYFSPVLQRFLTLTINLLGLILAAYLAWLGWVYLQHMIASGQRSNSLGVPMFYLYASLPVGAFLLAVRHVSALIVTFRGHSAQNVPAV
ncbi:TRAP transporter small permease [Marinobacterium rhizophilum]|uniref:TRAP transporter small permease protein n=1 Tax=Marinobacterium rhizophilum TaxID=420402 RepID=A0ABY5HG08_9GAMM|nr:TRAP transporter small permease subunit [Marinobacterium rhizophilum]UTW11295.1 TRAP transporter small permease [Marinobacterium rhizophilum]